MSKFPWRKYNKRELCVAYEKLYKKINEQLIFPIRRSYLGMLCSNYFFQYERMKTPSQGKISTYNFWKINKIKIKKYNKNKGTHDLFGDTAFLNHPPSQFPPVTAGKIYKYFNATDVFDPYAGWGDRCLAAMVLNINYTGIDSNPKLLIPYKKMIRNFNSQSNIEIIIGKSENISIKNIKFNFTFSSPPFWNKRLGLLEKYKNTEEDYKSFLEKSFAPIIRKCRKRGWVCMYIPKDMYIDVTKLVGKCQKQIKFLSVGNKSTQLSRENIIYCWN